jgi:hypothetical protein
MSTTRTLTAVALAVAALAAPAAQAQPADIHASFAQATAKANAQAAAKARNTLDLRTPDARDAARSPRSPVAPPQPVADPPGNPQPITLAPATRVTVGDEGIDWMTIGLGVACSLLAVGGLAARRSRRLRSGLAS